MLEQLLATTASRVVGRLRRTARLTSLHVPCKISELISATLLTVPAAVIVSSNHLLLIPVLTQSSALRARNVFQAHLSAVPCDGRVIHHQGTAGRCVLNPTADVSVHAHKHTCAYIYVHTYTHVHVHAKEKVKGGRTLSRWREYYLAVTVHSIDQNCRAVRGHNSAMHLDHPKCIALCCTEFCTVDSYAQERPGWKSKNAPAWI